MNIRNQTLYNKDLIVRYNRYYLNNFLKKNFTIVAVITLGFSIYMFIIQQWKYGLFLVGILVLYFILTYVMQELTTRRILKKSPLVQNPVMQTYVFTDETIEIMNVKAKSLNYSEIIKIRETKEFMIISDQAKITYIVDKKGFESQEEEDAVRNFLKLKLSQNYR
ncbi:MAG: YcxB family protein [Bacilli bacterium]|nr:YcxB family protein [Bacilli bacterium]MBN2695978.1 YcxB family protein [Bacilli bacterium]